MPIDENFDARRMDLTLLHAAITGLCFLTSNQLPEFMVEGDDEEIAFKVRMYYKTHKLWFQIATVGRNN